MLPLEEQRYARHFSLPGVGREGQEKLRAAHALVVGLGGLGSPVSLYLAAAGVGRLTIVDDDHVSLSNLQRQILFGTRDVGQAKTAVARAQLERLNPHVDVQAVKSRLTAENAPGLLAGADVVLDCSDNFATRYVLSDACVLAGKPLVFGAMARFDAQLSTLVAQGGPCYRCLYPSPPPMEAVQSCSAAGVLGALPGTVGALMATEALKLLLGIGTVLSGTLLTYDLLEGRFLPRRFAKSAHCPGCGEGKRAEPCPEIPSITWSELNPGARLVDVRTAEEFALDAPMGARNLPLTELKANLERLAAEEDDWILVCQSGQRSRRAAELLRGAGARKVRHVAGGYLSRAGETR